MKFLVFLALCFAAAEAGLVGVPSALTYSAPYTTYSSGVVPGHYNAPLTYSGYPSVYSAGFSAPAVYSTSGFGVASPLIKSAYTVPSVYSAPIVASTLLKK